VRRSVRKVVKDVAYLALVPPAVTSVLVLAAFAYLVYFFSALGDEVQKDSGVDL